MRVDRLRGILMLSAAAVAMWKGWQLYRGQPAMTAYTLGAPALGVRHLMHCKAALSKYT